MQHPSRFLVLFLFVFLLLLPACGGSTATGSPAPTATQPPSTPTAIPTPTQPPKWTTVQRFSGNGIKKTAIFSVPDDWKILYSCIGGDFGGYLGVTVYDSHATYVDQAVNAMCKAGSKATTGETEEHQAGSVYLDINGTGDWSLQVQVLK
jgi:hypothetical protein